MIIRKVVHQIIKDRRIAAYARVSTLSENQEESYETQIGYYTDLITNTKGWQMVGIYADQGITGTSAEKRPQFMKMIEDARAGKIDLILCKSVSRFSRKFTDAQRLVHELKGYNVEVRFEKEGISSFDPSADMIFGTMAAVAQEESRSISENVKWSYRRMAELGIRHVGNNHMLGYDEINGKLTPNANAWIVKLIFEEFARGIAPSAILRLLHEKGARRMRSDKDFTWSAAQRILNNEAYVGDRLLQKTAPQNYLTKKPDPTEAYDSKYIYNDHEGIISPEVWVAAQERMKRERIAREQGVRIHQTAHFLYGKVFCAECGQPYRRYSAKNTEGIYKTWRCKGRVTSGNCGCRHVKETQLLKEISDDLGWEWHGPDDFDNFGFLEGVEKVMVDNHGIEIIRSSPNSDKYEDLYDPEDDGDVPVPANPKTQTDTNRSDRAEKSA